MKKIDLETKLGGIFGMVALIAIIYEAYLGGFSPEATAGAVKDIAGTIVAILVLVVAVRKLDLENPRKHFTQCFMKSWRILKEDHSL